MELTDTDAAYWPADTSSPVVDTAIGDVLRERYRAHPDRWALRGVDHLGNDRALTYRDLYRTASWCATMLLDMFPAGTRLALCARNTIEWPILAHSAMLAGVVLVALDPNSRPPELAYMLNHCGAPVLMYGSGTERATVEDVLSHNLIEHDMTTIEVGPWIEAATAMAETKGDQPPLPSTDTSAPAMLQYTSGTTGRPKGVVLSQHSMLNNARFTMDAASVPFGAVCLTPMPMFHTAGCITCTLGPLWVGGTQILAPRPRPEVMADLLLAHRPDVLFHTPAILRSLVEFLQDNVIEPPPVPIIMGGASAMPPDLVQTAEKVFGGEVLNLYGQTELASVATLVRPGQSRSDKLTSVGRPIAQLEVMIADPMSADPVAFDAHGELLARGYQTFMEYLEDPDKTSAVRTTEGWVRTGDSARMDRHGTVTIVGRLREIIIRGGENIAPIEIEAALERHASVQRAVVVGIPDDRLGEVVAAVVHVSDAAGFDLDRLLVDLGHELARHKVPALWYSTDAIPTTASGKIQRFEVRRAIADGTLVRLGDTEPAQSS